MTLILAGQIEPLQKEIAELQSKLKEAQSKLYKISEKVRKAEEPVSKIKSLARDLTKMFENDPGIIAEIKELILNAFNGQDDTSIEKQEDSPVVASATIDEEKVTKDVVKDAQQIVPEPTKDIADDAPVVDKQVEDDKVLATNKESNKKWTPPSKNSPTVEIIQREDKINLLVKNGLARINEFTNAVELYTFYEELRNKHPDVAKSVKAKILSSLTSSARAWDKYKTISEIIPPGTPLEHDISRDKVEIVYYVRPCVDTTEGNQKYCEVLKSKPLKGQPTKIITFPEHGTNTRLALNAEPPSSKLQKQIEDISSNQVFKHETDHLLQSINIVEEINLAKDQPVPF